MRSTFTWGFCVCLCLLCITLSILVLSSSERGRESWLLCFHCLSDVLFLEMFCGSSSRCCGFVCSLLLCYFLILLIYFLVQVSFLSELNPGRAKHPYMTKIIDKDVISTQTKARFKHLCSGELITDTGHQASRL